MNTFVESVVPRARTGLVTFYKIATIVGAALLIIICFVFFSSSRDFFAPLISFLIGYLAYLLYGTFDVEYEYSVTHDYIEVSKIMSKRKRKTLVRINMEDISIAAPVTYKEHSTINRRSMGKVVRATVFKNDDDNYYIIGKTAQVDRIKAKGNYVSERTLQGGKICLLYITPDDEILDALGIYIKSKLVKI